MNYPEMFRLRQIFDAPRCDEVYGAVRAEIDKLDPGSKIKSGHTVAVAAGSRGVANIDTIVKATVDAFTGDVVLYVADPTEPLVLAYQKAFGDLFTPMEDMPASLASHTRYPEDLFRIQSELWGAYHVADTENFYQRAAEHSSSDARNHNWGR